MSARGADVATYVAALLIAALFLVPLSWLVSLSVRTPQEVYLGAARYLPENPTLENFRIVLTDRSFGLHLWNSLKICALGGAGAVAAAVPAAYAFSRFRFRGRTGLMVGVLLVQMVSPLVVMIPLYRYMDAVGMLDNHMGVIGVYVALGVPLSVWVLKSSFDRVPRSLEEAAEIDGCTRAETLLRITLPLAAPGLTAAFILNTMMGWSQFLVPFILLTDTGKVPISVAIFNFAGSTSASTTQLLAAACLVAILPALALFVALQRLIVRAVSGGAVRG